MSRGRGKPGRPHLGLLCPSDRPLSYSTKYEGTIYGSGPCQFCGVQVHGASSQCNCSYARQGHRLCTQCTVSYDYVSHGYSNVRGAPFTKEEVALLRSLLDRGAAVQKALISTDQSQEAPGS